MNNLKKITKLFFATLTTTILITSCGGDSENSNANGDYTLEVEKMLNGPFSESFEVTKAVLKIGDEMSFDTKLLVEVKRTSSELPFDPNDAQVCGVGAGKKNEWCISADILGENKMPLETNLEIYGYDPFEKMLSLKSGETIWLEFSLGYDTKLAKDPSKAKKVKLSSSVTENDMSSTSSSEEDYSSSDGGSENWDEVLTSYENYIDQYIKLMKKAKNGDASAMTEYADMMEKATDLSEKMENAGDELSTEQMAKFVKLQSKLANAAMKM